MKRIVIAASILLAASASSRADIVFLGSGGNSTSMNPYTYGFQFTPVVNITVTSLGFFDEGSDGLAGGHRVGIWDSGGNLLTSTTVTTANSTLAGPSFDGGQYRFTTIAGLNLSSGVTYTFGAAIESLPDLWYFAGTNVNNAPALTSISSIGYLGFGAFIDPTVTVGNTYAPGSFTAIATVPEPGEWTLLSVSGAALAWTCTLRRARARIRTARV